MFEEEALPWGESRSVAAAFTSERAPFFRMQPTDPSLLEADNVEELREKTSGRC